MHWGGQTTPQSVFTSIPDITLHPRQWEKPHHATSTPHQIMLRPRAREQEWSGETCEGPGLEKKYVFFLRKTSRNVWPDCWDKLSKLTSSPALN